MDIIILLQYVLLLLLLVALGVTAIVAFISLIRETVDFICFLRENRKK